MIPPKRECGGDDADQRAGQDVESKMPVLSVPSGGDVRRYTEGNESEHYAVIGRRGGLVVERRGTVELAAGSWLEGRLAGGAAAGRWHGKEFDVDGMFCAGGLAAGPQQLGGKVGDRDGELGAQEVGEVEETAPRKRTVSTRKAPKRIVEVGISWCSADGGIHQRPSNADILAVAPDDMRSNISQIRLAERDEMRAVLGEHVLDALGDEKAERHGQCQSGETSLELP